MKAFESLLRSVITLCAFLTALVPLVLTRFLMFPYVTGKNFLFRILVEIMLAAWLGLITINKKYRPVFSPISMALTVFVLVIAAADWQGANLTKSFWGNTERMEGFITLIHLYFYVLVSSSVFHEELTWRRFFQFSLAVSVVLSAMGINEVLSLGDKFTDRIMLTFGNPSYVAIYMIFHVFIALLLLSRKTVFIYGTGLILNLTAFTLASTRGAFLGLVAGLSLSFMIWAISQRDLTRKDLSFAGIVLSLSYALLTLTELGLYWPIKRLIDIPINDPAIQARIYNMGIAWQGFKERPWLGWGQENYDIVFNRYFDPRLVTAEPWFDRVHNSIFDWAIAGGALGLLAYLSIFLAAIWVLWNKQNFTLKERSITIGLLAAYFIHNLALFDSITSYFMFATILSWIISKSSTHTAEAFEVTQPYLRGAACAAIAIGLIWALNSPIFFQLRTLSEAMASDNALQALDLLEQAASLHPQGRADTTYFLCSRAQAIASENSHPYYISQQYTEECEKQLKTVSAQTPLSVIPPFYRAINQMVSGNPRAAEHFFEQARSLAPKKQIVLWEMALNEELFLGKIDEAHKLLREAFELNKDAPEALKRYKSFLIRQGREDKMAELLDK